MKSFLFPALLLLASCGTDPGARQARPAQESGAAGPEANSGSFDAGPGLTLQHYGELRDGISYRRAASLLGSAGEEVSSTNIGGVRTVMYKWGSGGMANMNAMFQDDKLVSKAQFGLK